MFWRGVWLAFTEGNLFQSNDNKFEWFMEISPSYTYALVFRFFLHLRATALALGQLLSLEQ